MEANNSNQDCSLGYPLHKHPFIHTHSHLKHSVLTVLCTGGAGRKSGMDPALEKITGQWEKQEIITPGQYAMKMGWPKSFGSR